ncbi:hypothetical protein FQZ97_940160 [compost metagenome]
MCTISTTPISRPSFTQRRLLRLRSLPMPNALRYPDSSFFWHWSWESRWSVGWVWRCILGITSAVGTSRPPVVFSGRPWLLASSLALIRVSWPGRWEMPVLRPLGWWKPWVVPPRALVLVMRRAMESCPHCWPRKVLPGRRTLLRGSVDFCTYWAISPGSTRFQRRLGSGGRCLPIPTSPTHVVLCSTR